MTLEFHNRGASTVTVDLADSDVRTRTFGINPWKRIGTGTRTVGADDIAYQAFTADLRVQSRPGLAFRGERGLELVVRRRRHRFWRPHIARSRRALMRDAVPAAGKTARSLSRSSARDAGEPRRQRTTSVHGPPNTPRVIRCVPPRPAGVVAVDPPTIDGQKLGCAAPIVSLAVAASRSALGDRHADAVSRTLRLRHRRSEGARNSW